MIHWCAMAATAFAVWAVPFDAAGLEVQGLEASGAALREEAEVPGESPGDSPGFPGLSVQVDEGRALGERVLRVRLSGAPPGACASFELGRARAGGLAGRCAQFVRADAEGCIDVLMRGERPAGLAARFVVRGARGPALVTASVALPAPQPFAASVPQRGDVVITEIMKDPTFVTDAHGEWFEIQNVSNHVVNLAGWKITDLGANSHTILTGLQPILLVPGQRYVLGNDGDPLTNGGVQVDYEYTNFSLGNAADSILLTSRSAMLVDQVDYDDGILWPDVPGQSLSLHPLSTDAFLNDDPAQWCPGATPIGGPNPDLATPGQLNDVCP